MYGNGFGINAPSMLYNPQNVATKEERNYLFNDNIVGIVIDPHEKNESVNLKTQKNKGVKINNDYDRANIAVKSTDLEKNKREASTKHLPRDHENTVNDESSDLRKFTFNENNDGDFSLFEYGNNEINEKNQEKKQHAAAEKTYQYHDTDTRDRRSITLLEKENSDINPDFSEDSNNLETHVRLRRHFPNFVRHRRSNAILPYQQSAFLQYHGAGADIEDNDGDEFDDDGLDDRTSNFIKKREVDRIGDDNDYDNTQTNYNSFANNNQQQNPGYFSQLNADNDQQQLNYNQFDDYSSPEQNDQQKRIGRDIIDEVSNSNFRSPRYENVQPNIKSSSQEYANRYDNTKLAQSFGEEPQTYKDEELTRLKRVKRQDDNFG
ncbi:TBC1 domain family member 5 homolog A-like [Chrysoperla carnea]|uniref:TBC1 domain family member 5 homolog A-like n=1 Tax=Chrysoperla carnea TaxID=189513 RepID=UPI001D08ABFE|nr:TBC1 domain family member 5 homolog A-like [Chrysoperla carnea]